MFRIGASLLILSLGGTAYAADSAAEKNWPQWRGPLGIGVSATADPPLAWSESQNIRWKVKIPGYGQSTPIVWGDRVFVQTAIATGRQSAPATQAAATNDRGGGRPRLSTPNPTQVYQFVLICFGRQTGKELWRRVACETVPHEGHHRTEGSFAAASPMTDGKLVFAFFGSRGLYCYDMDGNPKWQRDLGRMRIVMSFGEGTTPALSGDVIVVNWDHEGECSTLGINKNNGDIAWKMPRDERSSWATPLIVEHEGKRQAVVAASKRIRSYELETGKLIWECAGLTRNVIPSPVSGEGIVYATSGYQGSCVMAIRLGRSGDLTGSDAIVWKHQKGTPYVPSPLLYEGRLYLFSVNNAVLSCFDAKTGKMLIDMQNLDALQGVYSSPVAAGGKIYLLGRNGAMVVIKPSDRLEILATNRLDERFGASPALAGQELFLRGREHLYCIGPK